MIDEALSVSLAGWGCWTWTKLFWQCFAHLFEVGRVVQIGCDKDPACQVMLRQNWPNRCILGDVMDWVDPCNTRLDATLKDKVECIVCDGAHSPHPSVCFEKANVKAPNKSLQVMVAGPPCPPWSKRGKRQKRDDPRIAVHEVWRKYVDMGFDIVLFENVWDQDIINLLNEYFPKPKWTVPRPGRARRRRGFETTITPRRTATKLLKRASALTDR